MNVSEFFTQLSFGALSNLSIGNEGSGQIKENEQDKVVFHTNKALKAIYSRFTHNRDYVKIVLSEDITRYRLHTDFAVSNTDVGNTNTRYLIDSASEPFTNNLVKILGIHVEDDESTTDIDESAHVGVNINPAVQGVIMLAYDTIYIPKPTAGLSLLIEYQALHTPLSIPAEPAESIFLAPVLEEALELAVAARIFRGMGGETHIVKAAQLMADYEKVVSIAKTEDLLQESSASGVDRLAAKGFC